jgi:chromosome segregation ATPase
MVLAQELRLTWLTIPGDRATVSIDVTVLKQEKERLKEVLREAENELRRLEAELKKVRQRENQTKRKLEALDTLIDVEQTVEPSAQPG